MSKQPDLSPVTPLRALDIHSHETRVNTEAMEILQRYMAMAEAGNVDDLVVVARCAGDIKVATTRTASIVTRLGMLEMAKADVLLSLQGDVE